MLLGAWCLWTEVQGVARLIVCGRGSWDTGGMRVVGGVSNKKSEVLLACWECQLFQLSPQISQFY